MRQKFHGFLSTSREREGGNVGESSPAPSFLRLGFATLFSYKINLALSYFLSFLGKSFFHRGSLCRFLPPALLRAQEATTRSSFLSDASFVTSFR